MEREKDFPIRLPNFPVVLNEEMVLSENTAQVFMASRFIIAKRAAFDMEREFAKTIGTDYYRPQADT